MTTSTITVRRKGNPQLYVEGKMQFYLLWLLKLLKACSVWSGLASFSHNTTHQTLGMPLLPEQQERTSTGCTKAL